MNTPFLGKIIYKNLIVYFIYLLYLEFRKNTKFSKSKRNISDQL